MGASKFAYFSALIHVHVNAVFLVIYCILCKIWKFTTTSQCVHPDARTKVKVHYHGSLLDGTVFDSSVDRGAPISFGLNQVIKGWTEGLQLMVVGDKFKLFIPANLGYGNNSAGDITPGSLLIFEVTLLEIQ